jgi:hypothetical protein
MRSRNICFGHVPIAVRQGRQRRDASQQEKKYSEDAQRGGFIPRGDVLSTSSSRWPMASRRPRHRRHMFQQLLRRLRLRQQTSAWASGGPAEGKQNPFRPTFFCGCGGGGGRGGGARRRQADARILCLAWEANSATKSPCSVAAFAVNSEPHTGARPSVRVCVGLTTTTLSYSRARDKIICYLAQVHIAINKNHVTFNIFRFSKSIISVCLKFI